MITELGKQKVVDAYQRAVDNMMRIEKDLAYATILVVEMKESVDCPHTELEKAGSFMYIQTRCKECGFIWND